MEKKKVLIIIPAYNEQNSIPTVLRKIQALPEHYDIVVINDGSKDNTSQAARDVGSVTVIDLPHNLGIGGAMQTGYIFAHRRGYDIAVQVDADGQHNPDDLPRLLAPLLRGDVNMTVGSRYVEKTAYRSTIMRRLGMVIFSLVVSLITGQKFTDTTSGYRAVDREIIAFYARNYPTDYPEVEALVLLKRAGFRIAEVSVGMDARQAGTSSITPVKSIYYMIKVLLAIMINVVRPKLKGA
ncbi:glycosyltransferase family 2 protein [Heliobacterium chlorum]|uniref:Glycosyltransferase family 2 protein n=1 Tax=Heliobacterium chlorum TaxID=2698 RepID=A0ABR7T8U5_HELCL|nr:glycosyltransferase family 2 protein [Heliobacterium chlorum]MBC9786066.1 glycosyltransferase family 2 protein [Heliobacterium chlorum]